MQLCEMFLLCIIIVLGICVIVTDFYFGLIKNKILLAAAIPGAVINSIYMIFFAGNYFPVYLLNWCAVSVIAILLYVFHFWAAGDSKLTIVLTFLIGHR